MKPAPKILFVGGALVAIALGGVVLWDQRPWKGTWGIDTGAYAVTVIVTGPDEKPLERKVTLYRLDPDLVPEGTAATDAQGRCRFSLDKKGRYYASLEEGRARCDAPVVELTDETPEAQTRIALGALTLTGRVSIPGRDEKREGVEGWQKALIVHLCFCSADAGGATGRAEHAGYVDSSGAFRIPDLAPGDYVLEIRSKFHRERIRIDRDAEHFIRLPASRIEGRVVSQGKRESLLDALVAVQPVRFEDGVFDFTRGALYEDRTADENGAFVFTGFPAGRYRIVATGGGWARQIREVVLAPPDFAARVDFELPTGAFLNISVADPQGRPLSQPNFLMEGIQWGYAGSNAGFSGGAHDLIAHARGHTVEVRHAVPLQAGGEEEMSKVAFVLKPHVPVQVRFVDAEESPVAGVRCRVEVGGVDIQPFMDRASLGGGRFVSSDADGIVPVWGLAEGAYPLKAEKEGFAPLSATLTVDPRSPLVAFEMSRLH